MTDREIIEAVQKYLHDCALLRMEPSKYKLASILAGVEDDDDDD
jgi:hypothetical protein